MYIIQKLRHTERLTGKKRVQNAQMDRQIHRRRCTRKKDDLLGSTLISTLIF